MPRSWWKVSLSAVDLVLEDERQAAVQVGRASRRSRMSVGLERASSGRSRASAVKVIVVPVPRAGPTFFSLPVGMPRAKVCSHCEAVALDVAPIIARQRGDHRGADAVQAAGVEVVAGSRTCRRRAAW